MAEYIDWLAEDGPARRVDDGAGAPVDPNAATAEQRLREAEINRRRVAQANQVVNLYDRNAIKQPVYDPAAAQRAHDAGNIGGATGAYNQYTPQRAQQGEVIGQFNRDVALGVNQPPAAPGDPLANTRLAGDNAAAAVQGDNSVDSLLSEMRGISDAAAVTRDPAAKARLLADAQAIRDQVDALLASPLQATAVAEQMAAENRAQALSARGGAGAQQLAMVQAQNRQPALQAQASQAAAQEQQQRASTAAGMLGNAANVEAASTAFDIDIGKSNQDSADAFVQQMGQLGFGELQLNQSDRHEVGQMLRDFATLMQNGTIDLAKLSLQQQDMLLDDALGRYDISERSKVQLKAIAKQGKKDFWDKLQVVGGLIPGA